MQRGIKREITGARVIFRHFRAVIWVQLALLWPDPTSMIEVVSDCFLLQFASVTVVLFELRWHQITAMAHTSEKVCLIPGGLHWGQFKVKVYSHSHWYLYKVKLWDDYSFPLQLIMVSCWEQLVVMVACWELWPSLCLEYAVVIRKWQHRLTSQANWLAFFSRR